MPFEKHYDRPAVPTETPCIHLRNKGMYVTGKIDAEHPDEAGGRFCWCNITQQIYGPDQEQADRTRCVPGRECYKTSY